MSVYYYIFKNQNDQDRTLRVPQFNSNIEQVNKQTSMTASQLIQLSDEIEFTAQYIVSSSLPISFMGFLKISDYLGETWYIDDNYQLYFHETSDRYAIDIQDRSGNTIRGSWRSELKNTTTYYMRTFPCPEEITIHNGAQSVTGHFSGLIIYFSDTDKFALGQDVTTPFDSGYFKTDESLSDLPYGGLFDNVEPAYVDTQDPFDTGGTSEGNEDTSGDGSSGGYGTFDNTSDTVLIPSLPSVSGLETGFFTAFCPTPAQMQQVANFLFNTVLSDIISGGATWKQVVDAMKSLIANPIDAIMGCHIVPVSPTIGGSKELTCYGALGTGITIPYASSRWASVDCGVLSIEEYSASYLDFAPYSKTTSLFLPYVGTVSVDIDMIQGTKNSAKTIGVVYHVDILTGVCVAYITVNGSVKFTYQGQCSAQIPVTNTDYSGMLQSAIGLAGNVAAVVGSAGVGGVAGLVGAGSELGRQSGSMAQNVMGIKPDIKSGGSLGSSGGFMGVQKPYLIIERPNQSVPKNQNSYTGYPSNVRKRISDCDGYAEFDMVKLENIPLTDSEKNELETILKQGVYL